MDHATPSTSTVARSLLGLGIACGIAVCGLGSGCQPAATPTTTHPAPPVEMYTLADLIGGWSWSLETTVDGTRRVEHEQWRFRPAATPTQLIGRYVRTVEVHAADGVPFLCNQRTSYTQRATFDLVVEIVARGFAIKEVDYRAEPGPCDRGFRHLSSYAARLDADRLALRFDTGTQALVRTDARPDALAADPWPATPRLAGPWRWDATSYDDAGNVSTETEWWELTIRSETRVDATYRRRVTTRSPDGQPLPCANAPSWTFDDAYVLDGQREDEHWHLYEQAVDPGDHPCLRVTPRRALDEATAEQLGNYLILEWRGKRRQVLYRPDGA